MEDCACGTGSANGHSLRLRHPMTCYHIVFASVLPRDGHQCCLLTEHGIQDTPPYQGRVHVRDLQPAARSTARTSSYVSTVPPDRMAEVLAVNVFGLYSCSPGSPAVLILRCADMSRPLARTTVAAGRQPRPVCDGRSGGVRSSSTGRPTMKPGLPGVSAK